MEYKQEMNKTNEDWKKELDDETYRVTRTCGTEPAFSGKWLDHKGKGLYVCSNCGEELFSSDAKFDSGSGWPSFDQVIGAGHVDTKEDTSAGMIRTEVTCSHCGAHLGHIFPDGPTDTGTRYCINSVALDFKDEELGDVSAK